MDARPRIFNAFTEKLYHFNHELQGKAKTFDFFTLSAVNAFKAKMNFFVQLERKKVEHFLCVKAVFNDNSSASAALDEAVKKYSQVINRQEFENRFRDFEQLEPCVSFVTNHPQRSS